MSPSHPPPPEIEIQQLVILVGMPGCGKSTGGRMLARNLGLPFVDADAVIEEHIGCAIRDYFDHCGEAAFRDVEERVIAELMQGGKACVLATGGGVVLRAANRECLRRGGTVFYLHTTADKLYRRLRCDTKRPLLQVADPLAALRDLYQQRDRLYRQCAHHVIDTHGQSRASLLNRIMMQLELAPVPTGHAPSPLIRQP